MHIYFFSKDEGIQHINNIDTQQQQQQQQQQASIYHRTILSKSLIFPTEILHTIISLVPRSSLPQLALVNKHWNAVTCPVLYQHIYIRTTYHWESFIYAINILNTPWVEFITSIVLKSSPTLLPKSVGIHRHRYLTDIDIERQGYVRLTKIDFDHTGLEWLSFNNKSEGIDIDIDVDEEMENQKELDTTLKEAEWLTKVKDIDMANVIQKCYQLKYLKLSGCTNIGSQTMYSLALLTQHPKRQQTQFIGLWLDLVRHITIDSWMTFIQKEKEKKENHSSLSLTHLDLSFCGFVTDSCLTNSLPLWHTSLTHLRLNSLYEITDESVQTIALYCPQLTLLYLVRCWKITNQYLSLLSLQCPKLKYLSLAFLNQVNERGIHPFVSNNAQLISLDISGTGINPMFKPIILKNWDEERQSKQWRKIQFQEDPVLLI
ncbi:unnamed protein product [Cunninghamella blakesleeana]